ncbi:MAG: urease accessory protein UreD [Chroococcidiopsidaceae cyanobacterium CP_BM_ER_R8_30]|nr:urease accessory protein UreD [Chroococcidiopsidaceae cyanobacterium CP_BM_ER_R8_30]
MNQSNRSLIDAETSVGWHGSLELVFAQRHGATQLTRNWTQAPLKVQRSFYPEGPNVCHSIVLHTAGGIVGGDRLSLNFQLEPDAHSLITTATASKIYRSNGLEAIQDMHMQVAAGACLEWFPLETIVFNGAIYRQGLQVELALGASWLGWEIMRFGRSARGERFLQGEWRSHTEIWQQGHPLWIDRQWLKGGEEMLDSPHGLAGQPVVASLSWVGAAVAPEIVMQARSLWTSKERQGEAGVTRLISGLLCRYRGASTAEARNWFIDVWQLLRSSLLGRPICIPRVWQI